MVNENSEFGMQNSERGNGCRGERGAGGERAVGEEMTLRTLRGKSATTELIVNFPFLFPFLPLLPLPPRLPTPPQLPKAGVEFEGVRQGRVPKASSKHPQ